MSRTNVLSYPGVTAEAVPLFDDHTGRFLPSLSAYEAVLNCGGFSVMPTTLATEIATKSALHLKDEHGIRAIGYVSDEDILNHPNFSAVKEVFERFFGNNIHTFSTSLRLQENNVFGLRVNSTQIRNQDTITQFVQEHGDEGVILASIPMSDPSVEQIFETLPLSDQDTIAAKTLKNLLLNQDRSTPTKIAEDANGFIRTCQSSQDILELFDTYKDSVLVFKSSQGSAGGTNTFIISPHQRGEFLKKIDKIAFPLLAYSFIKPFLIANEKGELYSAHVRPFIVGGELVGGVVKYPNKPLSPDLFSSDGSISLDVFRKKKIDEVNKLLNSSSGLSQSLIFSHHGEFQGGFDGKKGEVALEDIRGLSIFGTSDNLLLLDRISEILDSTTSLVERIQTRVNKQLQLS